MSKLSPEKEQFAKQLVGDELLTELLAQVDSLAEQAKEAGVRNKDDLQSRIVALRGEIEAAQKEDGGMAAEGDTDVDEAPDLLLTEEEADMIADRVIAKLQPLLESLGGLTEETVTEVDDDGVEQKLKDLEAKVKELTGDLPKHRPSESTENLIPKELAELITKKAATEPGGIASITRTLFPELYAE